MAVMPLAFKVDQAIALDRSIREDKKKLDAIKAELQSVAIEEFDNKNVKYVQLFGTLGNCEAVYKEKFEIDNFSLLVATIGDLVKDKVKRKEEIKFEVDNRFKEALIALVKGDYRQHNLDAILAGMGLGPKEVKIALKKLKGDYRKDRELLQTLGVTGDREEELDAIREELNRRMVERYFNLEQINHEALKKCIFIEESLSIGLSYDTESTV
jgi:hypothetical protein